MILRDTIKLRKTLQKRGSGNIKSYLSKASLWIDPRPPPGRQEGRTLHQIVAWIVLAIPVILFTISVVLILNTWYFMPITRDKFPAFVAAIGFNKFWYDVTYGISVVIFVLSYLRLIKEYK